ncbi:MAG: OmpA family protein [Pseudomonadota bacterium]
MGAFVSDTDRVRGELSEADPATTGLKSGGVSVIEGDKALTTEPKGQVTAARRGLTVAAVMALALVLGACSTMSDIGDATTEGISSAANAMNPANWFDDEDDDDAKARAEQQRAVANTQPKTGIKSAPRDSIAQRATESNEERYPSLSTVPERPREPTSKSAERERKELREGLVADTANAQYTDNELRAQTAGTAGAGQRDAARSNERVPGNPGAVPAPTIPVTAAPVAAAPTAAAPTPTPQQVASTPRVSPPPVAAPPADGGFGARQAAAASAAPVAAVAPTRAAPRPTSAQSPTTAVSQQRVASAPPAATPAPQASSEPRAVLKTIQVATIYFNDGSSRLSANDRSVVGQVADAARRTGGLLRIIGHASMAAGGDADRAAAVNYKVSLDRANAVAGELLRNGIPVNQMQVRGEGDQNPIYAESAATGAAGNRRTEVYLDFYERL